MLSLINGDIMVRKELTFAATRTKPADVAIAVFGWCRGATIVDAGALITAVGVIQTVLTEFTPRAVVKPVTPASAQEVPPVATAVLPVHLPVQNLLFTEMINHYPPGIYFFFSYFVTHVNIRTGPEPVTGPPLLSLTQQSHCTICTGEILWQLDGITLCPKSYKTNFFLFPFFV